MSDAASPAGKPPLVLLHGWGTHGGVWDELAVRLAPDFAVLAPDLHGIEAGIAQCTIEQMIGRLSDALPDRCAVAGWSLGGQLALSWARHCPRQVTRLVLLATTPRFVNAPDWAHGMAAADFEAFASSLQVNPAATLQRFRLLQAQADGHSRAVVRRLDAALASRPMPAPEVLAHTLDWLRMTDLRKELPEIGQPTLVLHGTQDRLASPAAAEFLAACLPRARLELLDGVAHAPFVSAPDLLCEKIAGFCRER
ncbi:MAG: alpha/beta fold hydrolase [Burkholderiales bacterium]